MEPKPQNIEKKTKYMSWTVNIYKNYIYRILIRIILYLGVPKNNANKGNKGQGNKGNQGNHGNKGNKGNHGNQGNGNHQDTDEPVYTTKPTPLPIPDTTPACNFSPTQVNGRSACSGQLIFEENFEDLVTTRWQTEVKFADDPVSIQPKRI